MGYQNTQKAIDRVVEHRQLPPVKKWMRCEVDGRPGEIIGGNSSANFNVVFDDESIHWMNCHPYYRMKIFNKDGSVFYQSEDL